MASTVMQTIITDVSLSQWTNMFVTPILVVPPCPAGSFIRVVDWFISMTYGTAQLTGGGSTNLYYTSSGSTSATAGVTNTVPNAWTSSTGLGPGVAGINGAAASVMNGAGIYLKCLTANYAGGTGASFRVGVTYYVMTL